MRIRRVLVVAAFMVFLVPAMAMNASAALTLVATLDSAPVLTGGPYANVLIDLDTSTQTATVQFVALGDYLLGGANIAAVNVNASSFVYSKPVDFSSGGSPGWTGGSVSSPTTDIINATTGSAVGTFGKFSLAYDAADGATAAVDSLTFFLTNTSSSNWNSPSEVLSWGTGYPAAAHIFTPSGVTGFATVPLPSALLLLGSGLVGLIGIGRMRMRK